MRKSFRIDGLKVEVTMHTLERYCERVRGLYEPMLPDLRRALVEIEQLFALERRMSDSIPDWCGDVYTDNPTAERATHYVLIGSDIAFPIREQRNEVTGQTTMYLVSCLTRGTLSSEGRQRRNLKRKRRRDRARERRAMESWLGERTRWH